MPRKTQKKEESGLSISAQRFIERFEIVKIKYKGKVCYAFKDRNNTTILKRARNVPIYFDEKETAQAWAESYPFGG